MNNNFFIEINGEKYSGWTELTVTKSIENFCNNFSFVASAQIDKPFPIKRRSACKIYLDNTPIINGYIEKLNVRYTTDEHNITVSGRDRTCDLLDSQLGNIKEIKSPISLKKLCEAILNHLGLDDIKVIDPYSLSQIDDLSSFHVGVTGFDFIEQYAKKRQVLLTTNNNGDIEFKRSENLSQYFTILTTVENQTGTILQSSVDYDDTKRFYEYNIISQADNISIGLKNNQITFSTVQVNPKPPVTDKEIRTSRRYTFQPEQNSDEQTLKERAQWEANFRRSQSVIYNCDVQGIYPIMDKNVWQPGYLVRVKDPAADINSILLVSEVMYQQSLDKGTITTLKLLTRDAFSLQVNKPQKDNQDNLEGLNLTA